MNYARSAASSLSALAHGAPRVHCITNSVAMNYTANLLLAVGATPTMSRASAELEDFVSAAASLSINLGTPDETRKHAIDQAIASARKNRKPWVLDPVLVDVSGVRCEYARRLLAFEPRVVRGNASEISALVAHLAPRGEDGAAAYLARRVGTVVIQTGDTDLITDGYNSLQVANGHPLMTRVTAMGCAASALVAAFLAVQRGAFSAAVEALVTLGVAGELAGKKADGPGSFQIDILDQLYSLDDQRLQRHARVNPISTRT